VKGTGLYEILTTSWHAQLAINLALFGSLSIVGLIRWVTLNYMLGRLKMI
jgi:hypothetical protein